MKLAGKKLTNNPATSADMIEESPKAPTSIAWYVKCPLDGARHH
jgi:hypothetical protein